MLNGFNASVIFVALSISLPSCGFAPVYGDGSSAEEVLESVVLEDPTSRLEQVFLTAVEQRLPPPANPRYQVKYRVSRSYQGLDTIGVSRVQILGSVSSNVVDQYTSEIKFSFTVQGLVGYSATTNFQEAQRTDAEKRLAQILADRFVTGLMIRTEMLRVNDE